MDKYNFGEIVLLNFPFSDSVNIKRRPALILLDTGDSDIVVARITSQQIISDYDVDIKEWQESGLLQQSFVRLHKLATLEKKFVQKIMGKLQTDDLQNVKSVVKELWDI